MVLADEVHFEALHLQQTAQVERNTGFAGARVPGNHDERHGVHGQEAISRTVCVITILEEPSRSSI
jgi:hypothetical protein